MEILSLSFKYLPHHLKACFLFIGVFLEDHKIPTAILIKLQNVQGFLKCDKSKNLEEVAIDYLEHLIHGNLIMVYDQSSTGIIKTCIVHDFIRELRLKKAQEEIFLQVMDRSILSSRARTRNQRHIIIHSHIHDYAAGIYGSPILSVLYFNSITCSQCLSSVIQSLPRFCTALVDRIEIVLYPYMFGQLLRLNVFRGEPAKYNIIQYNIYV